MSVSQVKQDKTSESEKPCKAEAFTDLCRTLGEIQVLMVKQRSCQILGFYDTS